MPVFPVVKHGNVFKDAPPCICMILALLPINPLGFQTLEKGFGHRIALAITGTAHTLNHFVLCIADDFTAEQIQHDGQV